ncbi:MAG: DUF1127 domain-containing protein [Paracoccaceae bacterium]
MAAVLSQMLATTKSYNPFAHLASAFSDWSRARVTRNTLSQLSDHELNDIGFVVAILSVSRNAKAKFADLRAR